MGPRLTDLARSQLGKDLEMREWTRLGVGRPLQLRNKSINN